MILKMDKLAKYVVVTFCIGAFLALMSELEPWYNETFTDNTPTDAELCAPKDPVKRGVSEILYCDCGDGELQEPGKCEDKYK